MPRPTNTDDRRSQIVNALIAVMAKRGYDGASIGDIAHKAGLAPGLVHYHFKSKLEILVEAVRTIAETHERALDRAIARDTGAGSKRASHDLTRARDRSIARDTGDGSERASHDLTRARDRSIARDIGAGSKRPSKEPAREIDRAIARDTGAGSKRPSKAPAREIDRAIARDTGEGSKRASTDSVRAPDRAIARDTGDGSKRASNDPVRELVAFIDVHLGLGAHADADLLACWVLVVAEALREKRIRIEVERVIAALSARVIDILERGNATNAFTCADVPAAAAALIAIIQGYFAVAATARGVIPSGSAARSTLRMMEGLVGTSLAMGAARTWTRTDR